MNAAAALAASFGVSAERVARAPGRVNVIGEHVDYVLLPVMPMAIAQAIDVAVAPRSDGRLRAASTRFPRVLDISVDQPEPPAGWHRYVWAAARQVAGFGGADIAVAGDLFPDGGLSSSSALTVGVLASLTDLEGEELIAAASAAERSVGIEGGLMDQTVIVHAVPGSVLHIAFDPPGHTPIEVPDSVRFIAAHSGRTAPKADAIRDGYDQRVIGGRVAAALLAKAIGVNPGTPPLLGRLATADLANHVGSLPESARPIDVDWDLDDFVQLTARRVDPERPVPVRVVAEHAFGEARRVTTAAAALPEGDLTSPGEALDASHESLGRFGVSTAALDGLIAVMRAAGAAGARLTGAGFGGFVIAACAPDRVEAVSQAALEFSGGPVFEAVPSRGLVVR